MGKSLGLVKKQSGETHASFTLLGTGEFTSNSHSKQSWCAGRKITPGGLTWCCALVLVVVPLRDLEMEITPAYQGHAVLGG